ncbi:MAG: M15 family metallopeptidase [Rhodoluna sp.]|nr:M15 family metallopeptidase [Rhodoluna sp.]
MFQPKRRKGSTPVNRLLTLVISGGLIFGAAVGPAFAAGATPTPSPENTHQAEIPVTPSPDVSIDPVPTPTPSTPVDCGVCFNPGANSLTKANSLWVVANKQRPLNPITYKPAIGYFKGVQVAKVTAAALSKMAAGMLKDKAGTLLLNSGYRSYDTQVVVHDRQVKRLGLKAGEALAARPGYSEHQTGLAADVSAAGQGCTIQVCFAKTKAGKWLAANAWQYGFILRYPDGQTATTGYQFEPWHFRYVGVELATEMKSQNVTVLEKFWKLPAAPSYNY